jgi:hypothetical protein
MTIQDLELEINKFFLDSEKEANTIEKRHQGIYPNSVIMTHSHYKEFLKELFHTSEDVDIPEGVFISSICGLKVIFSDEIDTPRVIKV